MHHNSIASLSSAVYHVFNEDKFWQRNVKLVFSLFFWLISSLWALLERSIVVFDPEYACTIKEVVNRTKLSVLNATF